MDKINKLSLKESVSLYEQKYGFSLVRLQPNSKAPMPYEGGWSKTNESILNQPQPYGGIGVKHKYSKTIAIDIDNNRLFESIKPQLVEILPLPASGKYFWEVDTACSFSGRPTSGIKRWFRMPQSFIEKVNGINAEIEKYNAEITKHNEEHKSDKKPLKQPIVLNVKALDLRFCPEEEWESVLLQYTKQQREDLHIKEKVTVFEIRHGEGYDVLPPSYHNTKDENGNYYQYQWMNDFQMIDAPEDLLYLYENWDSISQYLIANDANIWEKDISDSAGAYQTVNRVPKTKRRGKKNTLHYDLQQEINERISMAGQCLPDVGATRVKGLSWARPDANDKRDGGLKILPNNPRKVYCFNKSSILCDGHAHSIYDLYHEYLWHGYSEKEENEAMCKLLGKEMPKEEEEKKSKKISLTPEEYTLQLEELIKDNEKTILKNNGYPDVLNEMCKAIRLNNDKFNEKKGEYIAFKSGVGVKMITFSEGQAVERTPDACDIKNIVCNGFFWDGGKVDEKTGTIVEVQPTLSDCDEIVKAKSESKFDLPVYDRISQGAFLTEDGRIISEFGLNSIASNKGTTHNGEEYSMTYNVFMAHTVKIDEIPQVITKEHVEKAKEIIKACYSGFWFKRAENEGLWQEWYDTTSFHNVVFALAIACFRYGYTDCRSTPIFVCNKNKAGDGASFLQRIMCMEAFNLKAEDVMAGNFTGDKAEDAQLLTSIGVGRYGQFIFDNMPTGGRTEGMEKFKTMTTSPKTCARIMYTQDVGVQKNESFIMMNGINVRLTADITRRVFVSELERPDNDNNSHKETEEVVKARALEYHSKLIWAFKVLYDYWDKNGRKEPPKLEVDFSSYLSIYNVIGGFLIEHFPNILNNLKEVQQDDNEEEQNIDGLLQTIETVYGLGVKKKAVDFSLLLNEDYKHYREHGVFFYNLIPYFYPDGHYPKAFTKEGVGMVLKPLVNRKSFSGLMLKQDSRRDYYLEKINKE